MEKRDRTIAFDGEDDLVLSCRRSLERLLRDIRSPAAFGEVWSKLEAHPLYREAKGHWGSGSGSERQRLWEGLCREMERMAYATRPFCLRCGECCRRGSPTLVQEDLPLLRRGKISRLELITLRRGEIGFSNDGRGLILLKEERVKIKEKSRGRECLFFEATIPGCRIYEDRPLQCRLQECWNPDRYQGLEGRRFLSRKDLFGSDDPLWPVIESHERHCDCSALQEALSRLRRGMPEAEEEIVAACLFDRKVRRQLWQGQGIAPKHQLFLIGRPLTDLLSAYGVLLAERNGRMRLLRSQTGDETHEP